MMTKWPQNLKQGAFLALDLAFVSSVSLTLCRHEDLRFYSLASDAGSEAPDGDRGL